MRHLLPSLVVFAAGAAPAQEAAWKLPERGAVEYRRTLAERFAAADSKAALAKAEENANVPDGLLPRLVMAPLLCQGELAADQRSVGDEPRDLRDAVRATAFDLRLRGQAKLRYRRLVPFGDLVMTGRVDPFAADGAQSFTLSITTEEPEVRPGESKAAMARFVRPLCKHSATGSLAVTRTFDAAAGVVKSFRAELTLTFEVAKNRWQKLVVADEWELGEVHENQDAAFRTAVGKAIRDGAKWVRRDLEGLDKRYMKDDDDEARSYGSGRIALGALTLLHAEVPADDAVVASCFDELSRRELIDTYSLGVALMAMAARYAPPGEIEQLRSGVLKAPKPRVLDDADKQLAAGWLERLRKNVDTRVDQASQLRFNYVAGPRFDNSVNQYGLLGLWAAHLCQIEVPASAWRAAANHLIAVQADAQKRDLALELTSYRELAAIQAGDAKPTRTTVVPVPARGFAYVEPDRPAYGSMTTAGIGGLVIARAGMTQGGLGKADIMPKVDGAILGGFAWLGAEFHVRSNPGYIDRADDNWYYYLYGLERACELAGVALVHGRDWYYEGGLQLLAMQNRNGSFRTEHPRGLLLDATCFAILFLKKATLPAVTGG